MAGKIIKGLAVATGAGMAIGLSARRPSSAKMPLLERLDRVEARLSALADLDLRMERQARDIEALQAGLSDTRKGVSAAVEMVEQRFAEVTTEVPAILESIFETRIGPQVQDLRVRLRAEMLESVEAAMATFERTIDKKVTLRIAKLEQAMIEQSGTMAVLNRRTVESDANMQRLISAVERLLDQTPARTAAPAIPDQPLVKDLGEVINRPPELVPRPPDSGFRPRIVHEGDDKQRRRTPLARL